MTPGCSGRSSGPYPARAAKVVVVRIWGPLSGLRQVDIMTEAPNETVPVPDFAKIIEEQKSVIVEMSKKIEALETASAAAEAKITALSGQSTAPAPQAPARQPSPEEIIKQRQEEAYEKILEDLGIRKKKE